MATGTVDFAARVNALNTIIGEVQNQINRAVVLAQILDSKPADAKNITWDAKFGDATPAGGEIASGTDVSTFNYDEKVPATLNYTTYHDAFAYTGLAASLAAVSGGPAALQNLEEDEMGDAVERMARKIGRDAYIGTGASNKLHGLVDATIPAIGDIGIYAGIDRSTQTQWRGTVQDAGTGTLNQTRLRDLRRAIYDASSEKPDLIIGDSFQHQKYAETFGDQRRYLDTVRLGDGRGDIKLSGGYNVLEMDGIPFVEDNQCPAGTVIMLNTRRVRWRQAPPPPVVVQRMLRSFGLHGTPEEIFGERMLKLMPWLLPLAINGDKWRYGLYLYLQLQVLRPNTCGYIKNLATS